MNPALLAHCLVLLLSCGVTCVRVCVCASTRSRVHVEWKVCVFFSVSMHMCVCWLGPPLEFSLWWEWMTEPRPNICLWAWWGLHTELSAGERRETRGRFTSCYITSHAAQKVHRRIQIHSWVNFFFFFLNHNLLINILIYLCMEDFFSSGYK